MVELSRPVDSRILGKILLIQSTLHANPTPAGMAEFVCRGLGDIPGVMAVAVRIRDVLKASTPELGARAGIQMDGPAAAGPGTWRVLETIEGASRFLAPVSIETLHQTYGAILLEARDPDAAEPYRPFIESLANTLALTVESLESQAALRRLNEDLRRANEGLESMVHERTRELLAANNALMEEISEHKRAVQERGKLQAQLSHAQKMESIGQFAGGIAHDFNNVLAAIVGYGNLLQMEMRSNDPLHLYANQILSAAEQATGLTQSLLAFSRKQVINPKHVDLNGSIRKVDKFLSRVIGEDITMVTHLDDEPLTVFADPIHLEQILMNLATNARDAMPQGGTLTIETRRVDGEVPGGFGEQGSWALVTVTDTGIGMDEETRGRIFEPFFTTKEPGRGTGLGLAIVYGVVTQNKGHIEVLSEVGKGSTFKITFPLAGPGAEICEPARLPAPPRRGTETILLAEDNGMVRELSKHVLTESGYTVLEAVDGADALRTFLEHQDEIQLIITDVIMPKMSGREFCDEARRHRPNVHVIFTSGYPADLLEKEGVLGKGLGFIAKPATPLALLLKVRETLDQRGVQA